MLGNGVCSRSGIVVAVRVSNANAGAAVVYYHTRGRRRLQAAGRLTATWQLRNNWRGRVAIAAVIAAVAATKNRAPRHALRKRMEGAQPPTAAVYRRCSLGRRRQRRRVTITIATAVGTKQRGTQSLPQRLHTVGDGRCNGCSRCRKGWQRWQRLRRRFWHSLLRRCGCRKSTLPHGGGGARSELGRGGSTHRRIARNNVPRRQRRWGGGAFSHANDRAQQRHARVSSRYIKHTRQPPFQLHGRQ